MTAPEENQAPQEQQPSNKELNFRKQEAMYQRQLDQERAAREQLQRELEEARAARQRQPEPEDDASDEPYVDHKKLARQFSSFERKMDEKIDKRAEEKARTMVAQEKRESWLRNNPDFYDVLQNADKFASHDPELAETILQMPEGFERQKLVYKNIKALGLHKAPEPKSTIQDKVDANKRSPYYQPTGVGSAPYAAAGDFSPSGQKNAYQKMQELKNKLRI